MKKYIAILDWETSGCGFSDYNLSHLSKSISLCNCGIRRLLGLKQEANIPEILEFSTSPFNGAKRFHLKYSYNQQRFLVDLKPIGDAERTVSGLLWELNNTIKQLGLNKVVYVKAN